MAATKRIEQKAATRDKLLMSARTMFLAQGYEAVTMRDLAKAAGVSTGAIFGNWADKAALFEAAMERPAPNVRQFIEHLKDHGSMALREIAGQLHHDLYGKGGAA